MHNAQCTIVILPLIPSILEGEEDENNAQFTIGLRLFLRQLRTRNINATRGGIKNNASTLVLSDDKKRLKTNSPTLVSHNA